MKNFDLYIRNLAERPGVYMMLNSTGDVIYVGKAKNLRKRVASYFSGKKDLKTQHLISQIHNIEVTITQNEVEACLLELQLIQELKPKYNIIFKDDKSYPYIMLTDDDFPQLTFYRGKRQESIEYYGPYPSVSAVRETLDLLQRAFQLRQCNNTFFKNRTRPCLQYQIKQCSAPCVGLISKSAYADDVRNTKMFLSGEMNQIVDKLIAQMKTASDALEYERAAKFRNQISVLNKIRKHQIIIDKNQKMNVDVLGVANVDGNACVHVLSVRDGRLLGSRQYFPTVVTGVNDKVEFLEAFILQHYLHHENTKQLFAEELLVSVKLSITNILEDALNDVVGRKIKISHNVRGDRAKWVKMATDSAEQALASSLERKYGIAESFRILTCALASKKSVTRIECFDISHTHGIAAMGACVVFTREGELKSEYRRYNIKDAAAGDDCGAIAETLTRHYNRLLSLQGTLPDVVLIDGGKGQLAKAEQVMQQLQIKGIKLVGIAKGAARKAGNEKLYLTSTGDVLNIELDSPAFRLLQRIRDEAHRFAITGHKAQRGKKALYSQLENIPGVGKKRRQELIQQFGGLQEVKHANVNELESIPGISKVLAHRIYDALHGGRG